MFRRTPVPQEEGFQKFGPTGLLPPGKGAGLFITSFLACSVQSVSTQGAKPLAIIVSLAAQNHLLAPLPPGARSLVPGSAYHISLDGLYIQWFLINLDQLHFVPEEHISC